MENTDKVLMAHGSGGVMMQRIIQEIFLSAFGGGADGVLDDAAVLPIQADRIAMSTDTFVVTPREFPGGDIGDLAVCGTVNDVATSGATVQYLSCGFILEEGLELDELRRITASMRARADEAGVHIVTGDTKVVEKGSGDGVFINTTGVGTIRPGVDLSSANLRPGDRILLSGTLGDHGITIMTQRQELGLTSALESDVAPLNTLIADVLVAAPETRVFRDPTRGGLSSTLNEFAEASDVDILLDEKDVPVRPEVTAVCEILGFDVFQVANEGKMVAVVPADQADAALAAMRANVYGSEASIIGTVEERSSTSHPLVKVRSPFGSTRILDMLVGEQLPRIC